EEFQSIISSFRPSSGTNGADQQLALHYVKVRETATYRKLAGQLRLGVYGDDKLRLINGHYPRGEPEAGQWIKILR
ncbi:MAG: peptidase M48, partial [Candidatus Hydrogenedentota bacterium]